MIKVRDILGLPVISDDGSKSLGILKDIIINIHKKQIIAFISEKTGLLKDRTYFGIEDIRSVGSGAIIVSNVKASNIDRKVEKNCGQNLNENKKYTDIEKRKEEIKVYSKNGDDLGLVKDVFFNLDTGYIEAFELSDGLIQDIIDGRKIIPLIGRYEFGEENIVAGAEAVQEMINSKSKIMRKLFEWREVD